MQCSQNNISITWHGKPMLSSMCIEVIKIHNNSHFVKTGMELVGWKTKWQIKNPLKKGQMWSRLAAQIHVSSYFTTEFFMPTLLLFSQSS